MQPQQDRWKCRKTPQDGAEKPQGLMGGGVGQTRHDGWAHWKVPSDPNPEEGKKRTAWLSRTETAVSSRKHQGRGLRWGGWVCLVEEQEVRGARARSSRAPVATGQAWLLLWAHGEP